MHLNSFRFDASGVREFIEFGRALYLDDARWIPPFRRTVARQLAADYPFYNRLGNDHCHFLAYEGSQVVGRVSAMLNAAIRDEDGTAVGLIGFFECIEDPIVATVLLDAARDWLRDQHGLRRIWGPMNFDMRRSTGSPTTRPTIRRTSSAMVSLAAEPGTPSRFAAAHSSRR